jgi:hypothetical protein
METLPHAHATARANARTLLETTSCPDASVRALAAQFEAALQTYHAVFHGSGTDDEAAAATDAVKAVAQKIIGVPGTDISIMRIKARVYLWAEATDLEKLAAEGGDWPSEAVLASLFRDLGVADVDAAPGPAAPASDTAPHPDAEIFSLAEKCATANQRFEAACEAFNEAEQRYVDIKPPQPLIKTEEDAKMRLFVLGCPGETYDRPEIAVIGAILRSLRNGGGPIQHIGAAEPSLKHGASGLPKKRQKVREPATTGPIALRGTRWACSRAPRRNWR